MFSILLAVVASVLLAVTLVARSPLTWWWIRACEFPRLQLAALAAVTALLALLASPPWSWIALGASLATLALQLARILPWTPFWPVQVKRAEPGQDNRCVTLLIANVLTPNRNAETLTRLIHEHRPDLVLTLESDAWWQAQLDKALNEAWPHAVRVPLDNLYGMHLYSRRPLVDPEVQWLIQDDIPSIHTGVTLPRGDVVRLHAVHPRPPAPNESEESLWRDAELLLVGKAIQEDPVPTLVAGDLNDVAWSRTTRLFCRVSGMLDPRRGRGMYSTFHASYPLLRWPLDHVFVSEHFTLKAMRRLPHIGSDHFPMLATLCYRPSRADEHETPEADREEHRDARETIEEGKERDQQE
ncbi:endonuclease/exonuclease/phosphatase (EEP) superfamily protein YafD [Halomonas ventosae]|uniref:Endonuclease/exonuclease/phosphatase (EEP) superfamily protein YafD n=1 Tax=Halomonas ventosae TaxID=229007 RepID=A0A4R6ZFW3_9GAMM|nr:endonuclease/exonuclease/phosphatase family protein [Halomonas ventosae]TDR51013.1 endonuclease/exonuclease/phosphatase (EEP) superfamily protein YafD [Halomonas ventosae]